MLACRAVTHSSESRALSEAMTYESWWPCTVAPFTILQAMICCLSSVYSSNEYFFRHGRTINPPIPPHARVVSCRVVVVVVVVVG